MRAVRNTERGLEVVDVPEPDEHDGDGVRVRVRSAGICGSDLKMIEQGPLAATLGHEIGGVLDDGTSVAIEPMVPCGDCDQCRAGTYNRCRRGGEIFLGVAVDGGMADELVVPHRALVPLPLGMRAQDAFLVEPLAVAVHGLRLAGLERASRVAVVGGGTIGLAAVAAAVDAGAEVDLVARHAVQRAAGERLGAQPAGGEYDLVVEAGGSESALATAADLAAPGATILVLSTHWGPLIVPGLVAIMKELRVLSSITYGRHASGRDIDGAAAILAARPEIVDALVTHRFPLGEASEAFRVARDRAAGSIKVVLEP